jgi:hypothetical protein
MPDGSYWATGPMGSMRCYSGSNTAPASAPMAHAGVLSIGEGFIE